MSDPVESPRRRVLIFHTCSLSAGVLISVGIGVVADFSQSPGAGAGSELLGLLSLVAGFGLLGAALVLAPRRAGRGGQASAGTPGAIQLNAIQALFASGAAAVLGFVGTYLTHRPSIVVILGAGAVAINLLWTLPRSLRLLAEVEATGVGAGAA